MSDDEELERCRAGLELDATDLSLLDSLIAIGAENGDREEAIRRLWIAARSCDAAGDGRKALRLLERLSRLAPHDTRNLAWLAQRCVQLTFGSRMAIAVEAATHLRKHGQLEELVRWTLQLGELPPGDPRLPALAALPLHKDPLDQRGQQRLGELFQKAGDDRSAAHHFAAVAESYARDGFFLKAVALMKQCLKLDPKRTELLGRLGELHQTLGLTSEAEDYFAQARRLTPKA